MGIYMGIYGANSQYRDLVGVDHLPSQHGGFAGSDGVGIAEAARR